VYTSYIILYLFNMVDLIHIFYCFFYTTATPEIYTLSLHDALPIFRDDADGSTLTEICLFTTSTSTGTLIAFQSLVAAVISSPTRSEEHTSELQSRENLVCRLLLEKKKYIIVQPHICLITTLCP